MKSTLKTLGLCILILGVVVGLTLIVANRHPDTTQARSAYKASISQLKKQLETKYETHFTNAQIRELNCDARQVLNPVKTGPRYRVQTDCFTDSSQLIADRGEKFGSTLYTKENGDTVAATLIADESGKPALMQNTEEGNSYARQIQKLQASLEKENKIKFSHLQMSELNCRVSYSSSSSSTYCYTASHGQPTSSYGTTIIKTNGKEFKVQLTAAGLGRYDLNLVGDEK
jgi:hypothetical protein